MATSFIAVAYNEPDLTVHCSYSQLADQFPKLPFYLYSSSPFPHFPFFFHFFFFILIFLLLSFLRSFIIFFFLSLSCLISSFSFYFFSSSLFFFLFSSAPSFSPPPPPPPQSPHPLDHREYRTGWTAKLRRLCFKFCRLFYISKRLGTHLFGTYLFIKLLYLANCVGQLYLMQTFLGLNSSQYTYLGAAIATNIITGRDWQTTLVFPRVGFCVVPIRQLVGPVYATAQCALPMNMLNERIYMFLWFWVCLSAILTTVSIPVWFVRMAYEKSRTNFVRRFLRVGYDEEGHYSSKDKCMVGKFTRQFLRHDGVFLLRMVAINAGEIVAAETVHKLWEIYKQKYYNRDFNVPETDDGDEEGEGEDGSCDAVCRYGVGRNTTVLMEGGNALTQRPSSPSAPPATLGSCKEKATFEDSENDEDKRFRKQYL
ncbi:hypothetical protein SprV_0401626400 [Sparganum proliferum]